MIDRAGRVLTGAGMAAVTAFALWSYRDWPGQWAWTIDAVNGSTVLTGPLTGAAAAAFQLGANRLVGVADASPRGWLVPLRSAWAAWVIGAVVLASTGVVASCVTILGPHGGPAEGWAVLVGFATLALCALAGSLAAYWVPQLVVVLATPVVLFLLGSFGPGPIPDLFRHGPSTGSLAGLKWVPEVFVGRVLGLVAACACLVVAMLPWRRQQGRVLRVAVAVTAAGALAAALVALDLAGSYRWTASGERPTECRGSAPAVCLSGSSVRHLVATEAALRRPAELLADAGVDLPAAFDEELPYQEGDPAHGVLQPMTVDRPDFRAGAVLLTRPAPCPQWTDPSGPPADVVFEAESILVEWLVSRSGGRPRAHSPAMRRWLVQIDSDTTIAWVVATYRSLRQCNFDEITTPWAG